MKKKKVLLKNVDMLAVVITATLFLAILIGLIGCLVTLVGLFRGWKAFSDAILGTFFGVFILAPVYGIISGILVALYNWVAKKTGGYQVTLEIEDKD